MAQNPGRNGFSTKRPLVTGGRGHSSGRRQLSEGAHSRSFKDRSIEGRGSKADQEKTHGKAFDPKRKPKPKESVISKDLRRIEKNLGVRH